jgi:hypothetical protein
MLCFLPPTGGSEKSQEETMTRQEMEAVACEEVYDHLSTDAAKSALYIHELKEGAGSFLINYRGHDYRVTIEKVHP